MECLRQIEGIKALEAPARGTTINFTVIHSGDADNVIPAEAHAIADLRVTDPQELERVQKAVEVLAFRASIPGTSVDTQVGIGSLPFPSNPGTRELTALAQEIYGELGRKLVLRDVGGPGMCPGAQRGAPDVPLNPDAGRTGPCTQAD